MSSGKRTWVAIAVAAAVVAIAAALWLQSRPPASVAPEVARSSPQAPAAAPAPAAESEPAIRYQVEPATAERSAAPLDVASTLADLFGSRAVQSMFLLDEFPRRFVASVDNLGRAHATSRLWPVQPTRGRFAVDGADGAGTIGGDNAARYAPFVTLVEAVDVQRAVAAYTRLYPQFQQAYEDLGYPRGYFNDRLVDVIDLLLATPEPAAAPKVHLAVQGPVPLQRPWLFYEFDDPALESLSSGQKILLRMGVPNERRVKAKLAAMRGALVAAPAAR
jgi:hypothetical protein